MNDEGEEWFADPEFAQILFFRLLQDKEFTYAFFDQLAADFNGDHKADLAITNYGSRGSGVTIGLAVGKGDGTFHSFRDYGVGSGPLSLAAADLNHDGKLDLAVVNEETNSVRAFCWEVATGNSALVPTLLPVPQARDSAPHRPR